MQITKLDLPRCKVGEGPVWDVAEQALYYIDIVEREGVPLGSGKRRSQGLGRARHDRLDGASRRRNKAGRRDRVARHRHPYARFRNRGGRTFALL